uniref:PCNA-associated factor histone-like domain-containing protein n=1 Tax=Corvus moneduloides TaxID=1196302 RepID=A0A8C3EBF0_CORMO
MARTKAAQGGRVFRKGAGPRPVGLNRVCVRPVPTWQRGISDFLKLPPKDNGAPDGDTPGTSGLEWVLGQGEAQVGEASCDYFSSVAL